MKTTEETWESLKAEYIALGNKMRELCESQDLRAALISFEYADGSVTSIGGGNINSYIGMLEVAKHKQLDERRAYYLKQNEEFNNKKDEV